MLCHLHVKNLALIDEADIEFQKGLNILTGETGAGKSILLGSINLALGQKMSSDMIRSDADYAYVELFFYTRRADIRERVRELGFSDEDGQLILTRKLMSGRSICRINGENCSNGQLKELAGMLLDIHGQHEHQSLLHEDRQLEILDEYGGDEIQLLKGEVKACYQEYSEARNLLTAETMDEREVTHRKELLDYEISEIEETALAIGEDEQLENDYRRISNAKRIVSNLNRVHALCGYESDRGAGEQIGNAVREISEAAQYDEGLQQIQTMLSDVDGMLNDFNRELSSYLSDLTFSEESFAETENRLNLVNHMKAKYGSTISEVLTYLEACRQERDKLADYEHYRAQLEADYKEKEKKLSEVTHALTAKRQQCAGSFEQAVTAELQDLNFLSVTFAVSFAERKQFGENGRDTCTYLISTNPGEEIRPLNRVASGGELSRIMLAIKTLLADKDKTETLLFDEIDAGISGRTAQSVAQKLDLVAAGHQVLCITHLPQIASMADAHYEISKMVKNGKTATDIRMLSQDASVEELARLIGGAQITEHTRQSAAEMKEMAVQYKNTRLK